MKASDLLVKALENESVEYIFTVPGEENLDLIESIRKSKKIKLILLRHEQGAGFMAATYGRLTGKAGVCLVTLGPGATNLMTSTAYAQLGGMPMIVISGQKAIKKHKQGEFQMLDIVSMMSKVTKMSKQIVDANNIPALIRKSFHVAEEERPGVVHLELPEDIASEKCKCNIFPVHELKRPQADENALNLAINMIQKAKSPLLLIGAGANRKKTSLALQKFVDKLKIPFFTTQMGKGVVDEDNECFLGTAAISQGDFLHSAIDYADLIVNAGHDIIEKPPFLMSEKKADVVHINFTSAQIDDTYFPQLEIVGDICHSIEHLTSKIKPQKHWDFKKYNEIKKRLISQKIRNQKNDCFPMSLPRIVYEVQKSFSKDSIISLDNGLYKIWFARNFHSSHPSNLILDNALATMGAGLSAAMAAKLIFPHKEVIAICGDGGFLMNSHELEPAIRLNLNLIVIILKDNAFGMIKWKQHKMGFKNFAMDFNNPDFVKYIEAYNGVGFKIKAANELSKIIEKCKHISGIKIIELPIDYSLNSGVIK